MSRLDTTIVLSKEPSPQSGAAQRNGAHQPPGPVKGFRCEASPPAQTAGRVGGTCKSLASYVHFFLAGLIHQGQTGGIIPSQRFLIDKMIAPVPPDHPGRVVELGSGSGALTVRLAARCSQARILACEINPTLARDTEHNLFRVGLQDRVQVACEPASAVLARLRRHQERVDYILSGIPLGTLDGEQALELIRDIHRTLSPGGWYVQFQHSLLDRKKIETTFSALRTVPVLFNLPPAVIYYAQK